MINEQVAIIARNAVETTLQLLMICEMKYGKAIVKPMSQKFRRLLNPWYYNGEPTHSPEIFAREIHEAEDTLFTVMEDANCKMSAALPTRSKRRVRKGSGLKGPRTEYMTKQLEVFSRFVDEHPITRSVSATTRAGQCWCQHSPEWDSAAQKGIGYSTPGSIARAFRNS